MNCDNCGAPIKEGYNRHNFRCEFCETLKFFAPDPLSVDGVQLLEGHTNETCPVCLDHRLSRAKLAGKDIGYCQECHGILVNSESFRQGLTSRRGECSIRDIHPVPLDPLQYQRTIACAICQRAMDVHPYYGPGNAVIDSCYDCKVVWLDHGEFQVLQKAPDRTQMSR